MITITIQPAQHNGHDDPSGRYLAYNGDQFLCSSRQPLLDAARILIKQGHNPNTPIEMRRKNNPNVVALRSTIGQAAKLTVREDAQKGPTFEHWKPFPRPRG